MFDHQAAAPSPKLPDFLSNGGKTGALMRTHDWTRTPLGAPEDWPQPLKTLVGVMLGSSQPMFVAWGPERILLYNDGYAEILAGKHPAALGRPFLDVWHEIRDDLIPIVEQAYAGRPVRMDDIMLVMHRRGYPEETHFAFSYTPVRGEGGQVEGFLCACIETTTQVLAARRRTFLIELEERLRGLSDPLAITAAAQEALGRHMEASRVGYGEVDASERHFTTVDNWTDGTVPSRHGMHDLAGFGPDIWAALRRGQRLVVRDVASDPRANSPEGRAAFASIDALAAITASLVKDGKMRAALYVHHREPQHWTDADAALVEEVAERTWAAVERARAEQTLREANDTLELLNRVGASVAAELDLERVVQMVTDAGVELTGAKFGAFFYNVLNEAGESYMLYSLSGAARSDFERFGMPRATAVFRPTFVGAGVIRSDDILQDPRYGLNAPHHGMPKGHLPVRSYLAVPVASRSGEVVGGLFFGHPEPGCFTERHEKQMVGIAAQAAIAIDNARLYQSAQRELEERRRAEAAARQRAEELEAVLDATPAAILIARDPSCLEIHGNRQATELMRMPPNTNISRSNADAPAKHFRVFGVDGREVLPDRLPVQRAARGEELLRHEERVEFADGTSVHLLGNAVPLRDESGAIRGAVGAFIDISERKRAEEHQRLLIDELNHRVKNSLAIVQGVAQQTFKGGAATPEARAAFEGRLAALSAAHNLLTRRNWEAASIRQIVDDAVAAVVGPRADRVRIDGPDLLLQPKTAVSLAMAVHELATNAVKYGSLSGADGGIEVRWRAEDARLKLRWREHGGPAVTPPAKRGFGTRMIERGLAAELGGRVTIDFAPEGLICVVDAPLPRGAGPDS